MPPDTKSPSQRVSSTSIGSTSSTDASSHLDTVTVLGLGSLLSERSARTTFPTLTSFRLGRVPNYRRVFGHPASIFFERGIADADTLQFSSLSAEPAQGEGFVCSVFDVPNGDGTWMERDGSPSPAFREREEEFDIVSVPFVDYGDGTNGGGGVEQDEGILCTRSTDDAYISRWGEDRFRKNYGSYKIDTIWGWGRESGLRPCGPYLRHCVLAAEKMGTMCYDSFLDETFLVDRTTTIREYLRNYPEVMETLPPKDLAVRYGG